MIRLLPLAAAFLPFAAIHVAYWLGIESGRLPACIPYIEGCTSISATGRHPPGSYVFKGVQLPFSVLLAGIWWLAVRWLTSLGCREGQPALRILPVAGTLGAVALILYTVFLGTTGEFYEFMRRFGIYVYFLGTWAAQLAVSIALSGLSRRSGGERLRIPAYGMLVTCAVPLLLGLLNVWFKATLDDAGPAENRIEWLAALFMQAWFVLLYLGWTRTAMRVRIVTDMR